MKRFFEFLGVSAIILFSFYYTEKAALLVQEKSPLMQDIRKYAKEEEIDSVDAQVFGEKIIPGLNGLEVNTEKSFLKMQDFGSFNDIFLIYDEVKPKVSLEDNKDKIIINGNPSKKAISIIIEKNTIIENYLASKNIEANVLIYEDDYDSKLEKINGESEKEKFYDLESVLNNEKNNLNICLINEKNQALCQTNEKYLVQETLTLDSTNIVEIKNNITAGTILLVKETARLEDMNILIKHLEYKALTVLPLSKHISENYKKD